MQGNLGSNWGVPRRLTSETPILRPVIFDLAKNLSKRFSWAPKSMLTVAGSTVSEM